MGDPLGLGNELSAAHFAVAVCEKPLVHLCWLHLEKEKMSLLTGVQFLAGVFKNCTHNADCFWKKKPISDRMSQKKLGKMFFYLNGKSESNWTSLTNSFDKMTLYVHCTFTQTQKAVWFPLVLSGSLVLWVYRELWQTNQDVIEQVNNKLIFSTQLINILLT